MLHEAGWQEGGDPVVVVFDHNVPTDVVAPEKTPPVIGRRISDGTHISIIPVRSPLPDYLEPNHYGS